MTSFTQNSFAYASYAAFRPSYPQSLYRTVLAYHHHGSPSSSASPSGTLLDLGCGHGLVARALCPTFDNTVAIDPSPGMVAQARSLNNLHPHVSIRQGSAEDLSFLPNGSIDLVVAGQAAHWFDYARAWPELARVTKAGGSLAFWGYKDNCFAGYSHFGPIYQRYVYGTDEVRPGMEGMGRFWEYPGRGILRDSFKAVIPPDEEWIDVRRFVWDPDPKTARMDDAPAEALWQRNPRLKLGAYEGYLRTFSSFNNWKIAHPEFKSRADGGDGDVIDHMCDEIVGSVKEWQGVGAGWRDIEVDCVWGTCLVMARRR